MAGNKAMSKAEQLLEAHVAYELSQWRDHGVLNAQQEVTAFFEWAAKTPLNKLTNADRVKEISYRLVIDMPLPETIAEVIGNIASHLIALPLNQKTQIGEVVDEALYESTIEQILALSELRDAIVAGSIESPLFSMLVSDILYNGIRGYLTAGTEKLGSVSGLLGKGADAIGKRLDSQMEPKLRAYIEGNARVIAEQSQAFLQSALTEERIRELGDEIWAAVQRSHLSIAAVIDEEEIQRFANYGQQVWMSLRDTEYVSEMIYAGIDEFFKQYGKKNISDVMVLVGVDADLVLAEAEQLLPELLESLNNTGYLEGLIRRRLTPFYQSDELAALL